ncbi:P-loop containing nucleoside triphosphate hydrolase protein [Syncephalis pseudoplumigaleata]|uniref:Kinesin-like protein n=1 Tax=Syncephalis pseudoplumigaleata TaxID=1712513 RepID=A0A4P9Z5U0_9FUNG|nr:P-loop containing nucleoside triphosphate hydrolase protein [Syncephalis pseudoplumigaleata]|eukprot:RKP27838.1 P-loop containing nucleoside triphosphate hydrolase protein [Syncephalis pseudoplumigaleata]
MTLDSGAPPSTTNSNNNSNSNNPRRTSLRLPSKSFSRASSGAPLAETGIPTVKAATVRARHRDSIISNGSTGSGGSGGAAGARPQRSRTLELPPLNVQTGGGGHSPYGGDGIGRWNASSTSVHTTSSANRSPLPSPVLTSRPDTEKLRQNREERHARAAEVRRQLGRTPEEAAAEHAHFFRQMINEWRESAQRRLMERVARGTIGATDPSALGIGAGDGETLAEENQRIKVYVRTRPMNAREMAANQFELITVGQRPTPTHPYAKLFLHEPKMRLDTFDQRKRMSMATQTFRFDDAFDSVSTNEDVYLKAVEPLVQAMQHPGARVTLFAYGQTGSGKTHTMFGSDGMRTAPSHPATGHGHGHAHARGHAHPAGPAPTSPTPQVAGVHEMVLRDLFELTRHMAEHIHLVPYLCFFEIHRNRIHDLLQSRARCTLRSDRHGRSRIFGLQEVALDSPEMALDLIRQGNSNRTVGTTGLNAAASRSHAVVQVILCEELGRMTDGRRKRRVYAKMSLVDLAGSERAAEAKDASTKERVEGGGINRSLLALKECIRALSRLSAVKIPPPSKDATSSGGDPTAATATAAAGDALGQPSDDATLAAPPHSPALSTISVATTSTMAGLSSTGQANGPTAPGTPQLGHVPFRASQLTLVLKDSLISPEAHTAVIACVTPSSGSVEHTSNTLRYARRVKTIRVRRKRRARRRMVRRMVRQLNADNEEELIEMEVEVEVGSVANESIAGDSLAGEHQRTASTSTHSDEPAAPEPEIDWLQLARTTLLPGDDIIAAGGGGVLFQEYIDADEDLLVRPEAPTADPALNFTLSCHRWALNHQAQAHDASYRLWQAARFGRVHEDVYLQQLEHLLRERVAIVDALAAVVERRRRERAAPVDDDANDVLAYGIICPAAAAAASASIE